MEDGEIDSSDHHVFSDCCDPSMESFLDELLKNTHSCTHTHTCNPPGPDNTHTHTCFHSHTQLLAPLDGSLTSDQNRHLISEQVVADDGLCEPFSKKKPTLGNREAVRKYREKKKAQTAYLEEQVVELRSINQQLARKLQGQAALEAEVVRLRSLLAEFRGRIDGEIGPCPTMEKLFSDAARQDMHKKDGTLPLPGGYLLNSCNLPCDADVSCLHSPVSSEKGPSTPQEYKSFAGGSGLSCEILNGACRGGRAKKPKIKE